MPFPKIESTFFYHFNDSLVSSSVLLQRKIPVLTEVLSNVCLFSYKEKYECHFRRLNLDLFYHSFTDFPATSRGPLKGKSIPFLADVLPNLGPLFLSREIGMPYRKIEFTFFVSLIHWLLSYFISVTTKKKYFRNMYSIIIIKSCILNQRYESEDFPCFDLKVWL